MRHPVYLGLRNDKKPAEITKEEILKTIPQSSEKNISDDELKISNPDKIYWPKDGYTKKDLIEYYDHVAEIILPYLNDRPQNLLRNPNGISKPGFFHKDINFSVPDFVTLKKIKSDTKGAKINYLVCQNKETLLFMANLGCIEINPWNSRLDDLDKPDYMIIDLDPGKKSFNDLIIVAREVHNVLQMMCADNYIKTSGKSGLHVCIPLGAAYTYSEIRSLSLMIAQLVNKRLPQLTSIERHPAKRNGKIYIDYLQNRRGQTLAAPYSVRPVQGAKVSTPLDWKEVKQGLDPAKFTIKTIFSRFRTKGDLWEPVLKKGIDLKECLQCMEENYNKLNIKK